MTSYRIETSCSRTGEAQHVEGTATEQEVHEFCTAAWRRASTHVVTALSGGFPARERVVAVYAGGRKIYPRH